MAAKNLRILLDNKITQVNGSATAKSLNDYKSQTDTGTTFTITTSSVTGPVMVVAMLAEQMGSVTMTLTGNGIFPEDVTESTTSSFSGQTSGYGGVKYVALTSSFGASTSFTITFSQSVKVSKFIIANYWSPRYNTGYGVQVGYDDQAAYERLQNGDLYTIPAPRNKNMQFDLQYMDETDKFKLFDIYRSIGKSKPIFVTIFPQDTDQEKTQMYSMYGKFANIGNISYAMYSMYSSSLSLTEV